MRKNPTFWAAILILMSLSSITLANESAPFANPYAAPHDPYEKYNRAIFRFNDALDTYFLKPVAFLYNQIMPHPLNRGIHNFFLNLTEFHTIANDALQLHIEQMLNDMWRLVINSTLGVGGFFDMASRMQLPYYANDFGLTLAHYGFVHSNYFVIPFWGPSTIRDTLAMPVDYYAFEVYPYIHPLAVRYGLYALGVVDKRAQLLQYQPLFEAAAVDKYAFLRNAYLQRRAFQIEQNGQLGRANMPDEEVAVVANGDGA